MSQYLSEVVSRLDVAPVMFLGSILLLCVAVGLFRGGK